VAEYAAKENKRTCKDCERLADPKSYEAGARVRIAEVYDCENCEVTKTQPSLANYPVIELYNSLPRVFDGMSGALQFSTVDIKFVFSIFDVPQELWDEYYFKMMHFHECLLDAEAEKRKKQKASDEARARAKKASRGR